MIVNTKFKTSLCRNSDQNVPASPTQVCHMADKCHFAHGKEELRVVSDPLPENAPLIIDQKVQSLNSLGVACLFDAPNIKRQLREMGTLNLLGVWRLHLNEPEETLTAEAVDNYVKRSRE